MDTKELFTTNETAKICGISHTSLLRLNEYGIDKPCYTDPQNGYHYYDVVDIHKIMQYQMFQKLGLSVNEMIKYTNGEVDEEIFLQSLRSRLEIARRCVDEFESRLTKRGTMSYSFVNVPDQDCYVFESNDSNPKNQIEYNRKKILNMYKEGYKPYPATPMFSITPDLDTIYDGKSYDSYKICVAVYPEPVPDPSKVVMVHGGTSFSLVYHGNDTTVMNTGGQILYAEMKKRGIRPAGPLFGISLVGPYFGREIDPEDYIFRWAVPVSEA